MGRKAVSKLFYYISIALTAVLAAVTLAGAFASSVSPVSSALFAFIGLALPVLLLLNLAVALYWMIRWRCWVLIPLVAIGGNWGYLSRIYQLGNDPVVETKHLLTLATYNVDSFGNEQSGYTCKDIAAYLRSQHADILCFQEFGTNRYFTADSVRSVLSDWPYSLIPYTEDSIPLLQLALFSKYPIRDSKLITYPDSKNCSLWCDLDIDGRTIRVFNNHLQTTEVTRNKSKLTKVLKQELQQQEDAINVGTDTSTPTAPAPAPVATPVAYESAAVETAALRLLDGLHQNFIKRATQAEVLKKLINDSPYPTLVCGDFNSLPSSYTYATIKGNKLTDGFQTCGHGYMYTYHYFKHLLRIDYVLHSKELEGVDYFSTELEYSDHNPVVMRVRMK